MWCYVCTLESSQHLVSKAIPSTHRTQTNDHMHHISNLCHEWTPFSSYDEVIQSLKIKNKNKPITSFVWRLWHETVGSSSKELLITAYVCHSSQPATAPPFLSGSTLREFFKTTPHTLTWYDAFISSVAVALLVAAMGVLHPCVRTSRPCQLCFPSSKQEKVRVSEYFESWPSEFFSCNKCEFLFDAQLPCKSYFIYHIVIPRKQHILWSPSTYKFDPQQGFEEHDLVC